MSLDQTLRSDPQCFLFDEKVAATEWRSRLTAVFGDMRHKEEMITLAEKYTKLFVEQQISLETGEPLTNEQFVELKIPIGQRRAINNIIVTAGAAASKPKNAQALVEAPTCDAQISEERFTLKDKSFTWIDYQGRLSSRDQSYSGFIRWVKTVILLMGTSSELPTEFNVGFEDNKPMPMVLTGNTADGYPAYMILLRDVNRLMAEPITSHLEPSTVADMTNRFVCVFTPGLGRLVTYHKEDPEWLTGFKKTDRVKKGDFPDGTALFCRMVTAAMAAQRYVLVEWRKQFDLICEVGINKAPTQIVEMQSLVNRRSQVMKRVLSANLEALEELEDAFEVKLGHATRHLRELVRTAEELERNAMDAMNLRIALVGFKDGDNMKLFTYISAVMSPLAVGTGWYGMNFSEFNNMEELKKENAYYIFIAVAGFFVLCMVSFLTWRNLKTGWSYTQEELERIVEANRNKLDGVNTKTPVPKANNPLRRKTIESRTAPFAVDTSSPTIITSSEERY